MSVGASIAGTSRRQWSMSSYALCGASGSLASSSANADADALCGHALGGAGELVEVESRDGQTRLPVTLDLDPATLLRELDAVGHRFLHAGGRRERVALAQDRDGGVV